MKITGVISSPNKNGTTARLVRKALESAAMKGASTEEIYLPDYRVEYCRACFSCMRTGLCSIDDDVKNLVEKIRESDGVILSSPTYGIDMCARMKNFIIDRIGMFEVYTSSFGGKYFAGISSAGAIGANKTAKKLALTFTKGIFKRAYVSGYLGVSIGHGKIDENSRAFKKAGNLGIKIAEDIINLKKYPFQNLFPRMMNLMLKKVFIRNIRVNRDGIMKGVYLNLKSRGLVKF